MRKIFYFFASFLAIIGGIGSLGFLLASKEWVVAMGVGVVCVAAFPTIKSWVNHLLND